MADKDALLIRLKNRRVMGATHYEDGKMGYHFMFKRLLSDGTVGHRSIKLSDEALDAMVAIGQVLKQRSIRDGRQGRQGPDGRQASV